MSRTLPLLLITALASVSASCSASLTTPSPQEFSRSNVAHRYRFAPGIDRDHALRVMADYPRAYQEYEESRIKCGAMNTSDREGERCRTEPDCDLVTAWGGDGMHQIGGSEVCATTNPSAQEWSQERERRSCLSSSHGVWEVYQLTEDGRVYGDCDVDGQ